MEGKKAFIWTGYAICVVLVLFLSQIVNKIYSSSGRVDYCYIERYEIMVPYYRLIGHRSWRPDRTISITSTLEEAQNNKQLLCPKE